jgi:hypothetical protein
MDILKFFKKRDLVNKINNIDLIIKITNYEIFDEIFMPLPGVPLVQPHWVYYDNKGIIKINLGKEIVLFLNKQKGCYDYSFNNLFELKEKYKDTYEHLITVDLNVFKDFSKMFITVDYTFNNKEYTNFYYENDIILSKDFTTKNFKNEEYSFSKAYIMLIKSNVLSENITDYFKRFLNNKQKITPEIILLNYNINISLDELVLKLI